MTDAPDAVTTGRPLDEAGAPAGGPALELDPDAPAAALLRDSPRPLVSWPNGGTWATLLETPAEGETDRPVLLQWLAPGAAEPPPHVHPTTETFAAVEGSLTVVLDGEPERVAPGESVTVPPGVEHTFRNDAGEVVAVRAELPSMRTVASLYTVWGRDHEGDWGPDGQPDPLTGLLVAADLRGETTMTTAPPSLQRVLWATVGRAARALGYEGIDESYLDDAFWERHVEQPSLE